MKWIFAAAIVILTACDSTVPADPALQGPVPAPAGVVASQLNALRAREGRAPVVAEPRLQAAARLHVEDLARTGKFSHQGSNGSSLGERALRQRYGYCFIAENIARGQPDAEAVLRGWMGSTGHRRNMLSRDAKEFGFARAGTTWVLVLGASGC